VAPFADYDRRLRAEAEGLDVTFHGAFAAKDLQALGADLAVFPTLCHESYGLVLDEAFMLGLPVVASAAPAFRERAKGGAAWVPTGDVEALAKVLDRAVETPAFLAELRQGIGKTWLVVGEVVDRLLAVYAETLRGERRADPSLQPCTDAERLAFVWRRSELRFASLLRGGEVPPPAPDTLPE
jgi:glycosyltransferase involved in cell wall biosynthesis